MRYLSSLLCAWVFLLGTSCSSTRGGNPSTSSLTQVKLQMGAISAGAVSSLNLCPTSVTLVPLDPSQSQVSFSIDPSDLSLGSSDVPVTTISVPNLAYDHLELQLSDTCGSHQSIQVSNTNGTFGLSNQVTATFSGPFSIESATSQLELGPQPIVTQLAGVSASSQVETVVESTNGQVLTFPIAFRQLQENRIASTGNSISIPAFGMEVVGEDLMVCWSFYAGAGAGATIAGITDSEGNSYARAAGPTTGVGSVLGVYNQEIWYSAGLKGGSNFTITATFSGSFNGEKAISCNEYTGVAAASPMDASASNIGDGANAATPQVTTLSANELVFSAAIFDTVAAPGSGFTQRSSLRGNVSEDEVVGPAGIHGATFTNSSMNWITQVVTFRGN